MMVATKTSNMAEIRQTGLRALLEVIGSPPVSTIVEMVCCLRL